MTIRKFIKLFDEQTAFYIKNKSATTKIKLTEEILNSFVGDLNINENSVFVDYFRVTIVVKIPDEIFGCCLELNNDEWNDF